MRTLLIAAMLATGTGAVFAADLRPPRLPPPMQAVYTWTGFYLGVNAGGGWSTANSEFSTAGFPAFANIDNHMAGAIAGGQIGYNWQSGSWVIGVEADFQYSGMKGGVSAPCPAGLCAANFDQDMPWFGTARGRLGYAQAGWLIYATGGYAYTRLETNASASAGGLSASVQSDEGRSGWTAGGGIEVAFTPNWSAKVEYLYVDLSDQRYVLFGNTGFETSLLRFGVNYRF